MSTTFDARDGNAPDAGSPAVALANEETLRRVFLEEFASLTAEARADLGEDARALVPKVVEGAFVRAWDARAQFRTPEEVHQFLVEDVHHAAARALSRRASAHRLAAGGRAEAHAVRDETPEEAWTHIMHALHGETHSPQALAALAAHSRHEAAEHIKHSDKSTPLWVMLTIFGAVLGALLIAATFMGRVSEDARIAHALDASDARPVATTFAKMGVVTLDDGTKVRLAPESQITIPKEFGPELRAVRLAGIGEFTVGKGMETPFRVNAGQADIVATGTVFTAHVLEDSSVTVVVSEGSVRVGRRKAMTDVPTGGAVVVKDTAVRQATAGERDEADAWRTGTLVVNDKSLGRTLDLMKRWYGLTILVPQQKLMERRVSFRASLDSTRQAIRGIEESTGLQFGYVGQNMAFTEKSAPAAKKR
ncbi:MAG TPA: FecR domain-containing protein [Gemmatimonadaceae bacterium]|nr:FecR domain-containing protein [Gemmatimonadaceae bacterium]